MTNKCPVCNQIVRKINGQLVLDKHTCKPPRRHRREDAMSRWARAYYDSEGHPTIGGPEDR
jgi:hypothetical protein